MSKLNLIIASALIALAAASPAGADAVYHSEHMVLSPVAGAPLRSGFIENIHANGPQVYAHEIYVLNGATPGTTYQVNLVLCSSTVPLASTPLTTNVAGNGRAELVFSPDPSIPSGVTVNIQWVVTLAGNPTPVYQTACTAVTLD